MTRAFFIASSEALAGSATLLRYACFTTESSSSNNIEANYWADDTHTVGQHAQKHVCCNTIFFVRRLIGRIHSEMLFIARKAGLTVES